MASLTQLEYLVAVDRHRHFGKAATACRVSQPTLSMQLHKLEQEYGITFFDRSKQPILPNPEALPLIEQAKMVLREYAKLEHLTAEQTDEPAGDFKIGVIPTVAPYLLPLFLSKFSSSLPKVNLSIREITTREIMEQLDRDELDAGIMATPLDIPTLDERPLYYEPFQIYTSSLHPLAKLKSITEEQLTANGIWLLSEGHCFRNQVVRLCSARKNSAVFKNVSFESGSMETLIALIDQGHGYTLLPALAAARLTGPRRNRLRTLTEPIPTREISLVFRRSQYKQTLLKRLSESIRSQLPPEVHSRRSAQLSVIPLK